uniref:Putative secreted protein n=1 Tax=Anopheles darlingi TaxID=43151 RepID=A0A2M4DIB4_ANODA
MSFSMVWTVCVCVCISTISRFFFVTTTGSVCPFDPFAPFGMVCDHTHTQTEGQTDREREREIDQVVCVRFVWI